jgi:hypothetical protein
MRRSANPTLVVSAVTTLMYADTVMSPVEAGPLASSAGPGHSKFGEGVDAHETWLFWPAASPRRWAGIWR